MSVDVSARKRSRTRTTLLVLFVVYLALLVWAVLWKLDVPWTGGTRRTVKLVPFVASGGHGASQPFEVATNLLLFVPFGLYLGLLAPAWRWWRHVGVIAGASLGLETVQLVLAVGSSDVTDVVVNTAGGLAGLVLLARVRRRLQGRTALVVMRACSVATALALIASAAFVASPVRFGGPPPGGGREPAMRLERSTMHRETMHRETMHRETIHRETIHPGLDTSG
ncbi:VanZ family protein [Xylanimonas cellulosilytica DSM 15894]|uniref:VanZ family protein n=1 Tax=Xylanimonas cellulosilytica (strain DSM 15894 / JCM 12276 / CECT 5975 / KCTC 9989 / LMG 20990 / NBRC 107835 / XIL07) TaxID=446471 RepID=D1BRJ8_XYLCX|nr:VanZ family protein [Xylanimonas cellulosilytica]ACZ30453.1 VanZ family protein [Xylanimonas cellulosilytica DSM 15894]